MAKRVKRQIDSIPVFESSGNVFADMGLPDPEGELAKAQLASRIYQVVSRARLTQIAAARRMGLDQPKVSALMNGRLEGFSAGRLMRCLVALGEDVEIVVRTKPRGRRHGRLRVVAAA